MNVAVIGATGKTGSAAAKALLARGHQVRAVVRDGRRVNDVMQLGASTAVCDLADKLRLRAAFDGVDGVYYCSPLGAGHREPFTVERSWARNAFDAAKAAAVRHFVFLSVQGPEHAPGVELLESKRQLEQTLAGTDLPYTVLRANVFLDNPVVFARHELLAGRFSWPLSPSAVVQPVAVHDIGEIAARVLETGPRNGPINVLGPAPLTLAQLTDVLARGLGRRIEYHELTDEDFIGRLGPFVGRPLAEALAAIYRLFERESPVGDPAHLRSELGVSLTSCEDYVRGLSEAFNDRAS